jgi:hypothetical protein
MTMMMMMRMTSPAARSAAVEGRASVARLDIPQRWLVKSVRPRRGKQAFLSG